MNNKSLIRNFSVIAHIDHGKTTLTDRFLEITKTIENRLMHERMLDSHPIAQERGVTIKLAPVRMNYILNSKFYILNLIDTPGHIDFSYEVSRSLAACEGVVLLIDATKGIQAQTLTNFNLAKKLNLKIIPVINKIDLGLAMPAKTADDLVGSLGFKKEEIVFISAKTGENVAQVLKRVIEDIPGPKGDGQKPLRALVFDSFYHVYKGVVVYLRVVDGCLEAGQNLKMIASQFSFKPLEIGWLTPGMKKTDRIANGEVGYVATGLKDINLCQVGDTIIRLKIKDQGLKIIALPGYIEPKPVVFFDFYPVENKDFALLEDAVSQLKLNDSSLVFLSVGSPSLGKGLRMGFLGVFHALITQERLERDYNLEIVVTSPSVVYQIKEKGKELKTIHNASEISDFSLISEIKEPWARIFIFTPFKYFGNIFKLVQDKRGKFVNQEYIGSYVNLEYEIPIIELITGFYDELKSVSSGFASLDYQLLDFRPFNAAVLEVWISREKVEALSLIIVKDKAEYVARKLAKKLKEVIPRQLFEVPIQISINGRIIARETIKAYRKDVTAKLYGGDQTRKDKLLKKQKKGKKRMKEIGKLTIPQEAFMAVLKIK